MDWQGIPITDGTGQRDRMPAAFAPDYFKVDELSFENLLAMGAEFAAQIKYYNLGNQLDGNWGELFYADEAVIMASILSTDLKRMESEFRAISYNEPAELANYILRLVERIDVWFRRLSASDYQAGELLAHKIETLISDKLAPELHNLGLIVDHAEIVHEVDLAGFAGAWGLVDPESENPYPRSTIETLPTPGEIKRRLSANFYTFSNSIAYLQTTAETLLQRSLESERHDPAIGLFIVFLQLFKKAQNQLNRFTPRHLEFYYRQVLEAANRPHVPDNYYLLLETLPGVGKVTIDKKTAFSSGKDEDLNDVVYRAEQDLVVSDARLESLFTLNFQRDRLISPELDLDFVTRIKFDQPVLDANQRVDGSAPGEPAAWALFGAGQPGNPSKTSADARLGFSIASPVLLLEQGRRKIEISFELEPEKPIELEARLESLRQCKDMHAFRQQFGELFALYLLQFKGDLNQQQKTELIDMAVNLMPTAQAAEVESLLQQDWQGLFYRLFKKPFRIKLTTDDGWMDVEDSILLPYSEDEMLRKTGFRILLSLGQANPPVSAYQADLHGGELPSALPVLQCELDPQAHFCVYSVFQSLVLTELQIEVEVSGVKGLQIYNQNGQLDPGKPFQPFGPLPSASSYFVFGNHEMAKKQLRELKINLDWAELPMGAGGFNEYYSAYASALGNDSFEVAFSALAESRWMPTEPAAQPCFKLFQTRSPGNGVVAKTAIEVNELAYARAIDPGIEAADFRFDLKSREGFYRLALVNPPNGFGHGEYTRLLTSVLTANAKKKKPDPVPNPPYTPTLNGISLSYRAGVTIKPALDPDRVERVFHLHPFGLETVYPMPAGQQCFLMPQYEHEGNLFIGLSASDIAGRLSLLFHLAHDRVDLVNARKAGLDWFYLADDRWIRLPENRILADDTHGLLASGRITLDIPADISAENSVMPRGLYWLRLVAESSVNAFSACYFVKPHAVRVSRHAQTGSEEKLPREINWAQLDNLPGISSVTQAYPSFGGRAAESEEKFRQRVSERLRHKNRALLPLDYEQLVLEEFPELGKVKCFNSLSRAEASVKPGHVLVVVVPRVDDAMAAGCKRERVDARELEQISSFLRELCPAFVSLEVINPTYEQIQVRCTVKFADALSEGINLKRLDQQVSDYLCPWKAPGYEARFGWSIRQRDIESHILSLGYIDFVTNFSMLHITVDQDGNYNLFDTAKGELKHEAVIRPRYPWSLAIPMENHFIETTRESRSIKAEITGIDELEVGTTFIIGSSTYGEEK